MGSSKQVHTEQVEAIQTILTAVNEPMTSAQLLAHPSFKPVEVPSRTLGQILGHMKKRGQVKSKGEGSKYRKWYMPSHAEAKTMKLTETLKTFRVEISKSKNTISFVIDGLKVEVGVVA